MKNLAAILTTVAFLASVAPPAAFAVNTATHGQITGKKALPRAFPRFSFGLESVNISIP